MGECGRFCAASARQFAKDIAKNPQTQFNSQIIFALITICIIVIVAMFVYEFYRKDKNG